MRRKLKDVINTQNCFFVSISPLWKVRVGLKAFFPGCYFTDFFLSANNGKEERKKSVWGEQMVVAEWHLALCLISGEGVRL